MLSRSGAKANVFGMNLDIPCNLLDPLVFITNVLLLPFNILNVIDVVYLCLKLYKNCETNVYILFVCL